MCHLRWALKCEVLPYTFPQPGMWHEWMFFLRKCAPAGPSRSASWQLGQSQVALPVYLRWDRGDGTLAKDVTPVDCEDRNEEPLVAVLLLWPDELNIVLYVSCKS